MGVNRQNRSTLLAWFSLYQKAAQSYLAELDLVFYACHQIILVPPIKRNGV